MRTNATVSGYRTVTTVGDIRDCEGLERMVQNYSRVMITWSHNMAIHSVPVEMMMGWLSVLTNASATVTVTL